MSQALAIGEKLGEANPEVERLMVPMVEGRMTLKSMLADQEQFVGQAAKFKKFNQEAGAIESHISSCKRLLPEFNQRPNEEVSSSKHHKHLLSSVKCYVVRCRFILY